MRHAPWVLAVSLAAACGSPVPPRQADGADCNYAEAATACGERSYCDPGEPVAGQGGERVHRAVDRRGGRHQPVAPLVGVEAAHGGDVLVAGAAEQVRLRVGAEAERVDADGLHVGVLPGVEAPRREVVRARRHQHRRQLAPAVRGEGRREPPRPLPVGQRAEAPVERALLGLALEDRVLRRRGQHVDGHRGGVEREHLREALVEAALVVAAEPPGEVDVDVVEAERARLPHDLREAREVGRPPHAVEHLPRRRLHPAAQPPDAVARGDRQRAGLVGAREHLQRAPPGRVVVEGRLQRVEQRVELVGRQEVGRPAAEVLVPHARAAERRAEERDLPARALDPRVELVVARQELPPAVAEGAELRAVGDVDVHPDRVPLRRLGEAARPEFGDVARARRPGEAEEIPVDHHAIDGGGR
jgi:hypothetical protein